jgi:predicted amidohydrolase
VIFSAALIQHEAYDVKSSAEGLSRVLNLIDQAAAARPSLIVLPECSYPGYYLGLESDPHKALASWEEALTEFRNRAQKHGVHIVAGIGELDGETAYNSAYLLGPEGEIIGRARKTFLWHFDSRWYVPGDEYRVFDTPLGKIGILICADGRLPEISRVLALKGAEVIVDPTNWVSTARDPADLRNPQADHMIQTRALENGVWFLCANKVGTEAESVAYCGQSMVVAPDGSTVVKGSANVEEIITAEVRTDRARTRRPWDLRKEFFREEYSLLTAPGERTPLASVLDSTVTPERSLCHVAVIQVDRDISLQDFLHSGAQMARRMAEQGADLIVLPEVPVTVMRDFGTQVKDAFAPVSAMTGARIAVTLKGALRPVTGIFEPNGNILTLSEESSPVIEVGGARIGFIRGSQGLVPEESRLLFLKGADVLVWQAGSSTGHEIDVAVTRALENRVYVVLANCASKDRDRNSLIVSPAGRILAQTFPYGKQGIIAQVSAAESRVKQLVRGTDVFRNRLPHLYGALSSV